MKKLLFVINTLGRAGAETALMELMRRLDPKEYEMHLFVLLGQGEMIRQVPEHVKLLNRRYDDCSVLSREGKRHLRRNVLRALFARGAVFRTAPYLLRQFFSMLRRGRIQPDKLLWRTVACGAPRFGEHYDLAVAYLEGGATYYVADFADADKKAAFLHVDYGRAGYNRSLDHGCYGKMDQIFTVSEEVRESFLLAYPECRERTAVFHNLLDQESIRAKAKLPGGFSDDYAGMRILTVGRLTSQKSFEISVEAMKLLKEAGEHVRWYILGEGEKRGELEALIRRLNLTADFLLPGAVENPYPYMAQADLYVHATRFEGKSIAIQEAQTLGCAIIVSDCSGNREQVVQGVDGVLCELTPEALAGAIRELVHDAEKRERLGKAAASRQLSDPGEPDKLLKLLR